MFKQTLELNYKYNNKQKIIMLFKKNKICAFLIEFGLNIF